MAHNERYEDDDGRVVASMSDIEPTPILIPRFDRLQGDRKEARPDFEDPEAGAGQSDSPYGETFTVTREERNAMIKGGIAAGLLIVAAIAGGFALLIFLIGHMGH